MELFELHKTGPLSYRLEYSPMREGFSPRSTQKIVLDAYLLNTKYFKVEINGKVEQSKKRCSAFSYTSV